MNRRTVENCVETLQKVLDVHQSQLGTGTVEEIEVVIAVLKEHRDSWNSNGVPVEWAARVLKILGDVVRLITNVNDFLN